MGVEANNNTWYLQLLPLLSCLPSGETSQMQREDAQRHTDGDALSSDPRFGGLIITTGFRVQFLSGSMNMIFRL